MNAPQLSKYLEFRSAGATFAYEAATFGLACMCCGKRNTERMGKNLYRCQHTGITGELRIVDGYPVLMPLTE